MNTPFYGENGSTIFNYETWFDISMTAIEVETTSYTYQITNPASELTIILGGATFELTSPDKVIHTEFLVFDADDNDLEVRSLVAQGGEICSDE